MITTQHTDPAGFNPTFLLWRAQYAEELVRMTGCAFRLAWQMSADALAATEHHPLSECDPKDEAYNDVLECFGDD